MPTPPPDVREPAPSDRRKVTTKSLQRMKERREPIAALTAYDHLMAQLVDKSGVDVILVGDSVAMVVQGRETTVTVTMEQLLYHATIVSSGVERALLVAPMILVLIVELLNGAIEATVDRIGLERHQLSGLAKDIGSAAVMLSFILLGGIWLLVLLDH